MLIIVLQLCANIVFIVHVYIQCLMKLLNSILGNQKLVVRYVVLMFL